MVAIVGRCPSSACESGHPVAASHRAQPLHSCSAGASRDPARGRGRTDDLGPCRGEPTPAEPLRGGASVEIARGKGNPEGTEGEPEPGHGRRERTGERRTKGRTRRANGKPEESPPRETGGREVRPQTARARARGSGAARIYAAAGAWRTAHGRTPPSWPTTRSGSTSPGRYAPRERRPASSAVRRSQTTVDTTVIAARVAA